MYVVLGANGRAGGETAHALIDMGKPVRVVLRRPEQAHQWTRQGADIALGSIEDVPSLTAALRGAAGAFLLCPPPVSGNPYQRADELAAALAQTVREAKPPRLVVLSSIGAQHETGTGVIATLNTLERHLKHAAPSTTFLRPGYFIETWGEVAPAVINDGVLPSFLDLSRQFPMVSTIDIGRTAAQLLTDSFSGERIVELRGPQDWNPADVAAAFATALGRPILPAFIPPEARPDILAQEGVPSEVAAALLGMYDGINGGRVGSDPDAEQRRGSVTLADAIKRLLHSR